MAESDDHPDHMDGYHSLCRRARGVGFHLSRLPLNAAFPLTSLSYCGIALTGRFILKEPVSTRRWIGIALISIGAAIVGSTT